MTIPKRIKYGLVGVVVFEVLGLALFIAGFILAATAAHNRGPLFVPAILLFSPVHIILAGLAFLVGYVIGVFKEKK